MASRSVSRGWELSRSLSISRRRARCRASTASSRTRRGPSGASAGRWSTPAATRTWVCLRSGRQRANQISRAFAAIDAIELTGRRLPRRHRQGEAQVVQHSLRRLYAHARRRHSREAQPRRQPLQAVQAAREGHGDDRHRVGRDDARHDTVLAQAGDGWELCGNQIYTARSRRPRRTD